MDNKKEGIGNGTIVESRTLTLRKKSEGSGQSPISFLQNLEGVV